MNEIHPTAIVSKKAELGKNIKIGPYTIIEEDVVIEDNTMIGSHCYIYSGTKIGKDNQIYSYCNLGGLPQDISFNPKTPTKLIIGEGNIIREYVNIHRATFVESATLIGNKNYIMGSVHIAHDCIIGNETILTHSSIFAGHVKIGNKVFVSGLVGVHQFCRIGDFAIIGGVVKIAQDVPPFMMVDGNPAQVVGINIVGLKRANFTEERKRNIKNAYKILYRKKLSISNALEVLKKEFTEDQDIQLLIEFIENSKRGIIGGVRETKMET
ncbi:MAG: acyl-ACP--UDP-N-acetylglucosamine O-acyltransferase [Leptonema sp. (in: bacteria)]